MVSLLCLLVAAAPSVAWLGWLLGGPPPYPMRPRPPPESMQTRHPPAVAPITTHFAYAPPLHGKHPCHRGLHTTGMIPLPGEADRVIATGGKLVLLGWNQDLPRFEITVADTAGRRLGEAVHDIMQWPTPEQRHDAWLNRRLAVTIDGIGDVATCT